MGGIICRCCFEDEQRLHSSELESLLPPGMEAVCLTLSNFVIYADTCGCRVLDHGCAVWETRVIIKPSFHWKLFSSTSYNQLHWSGRCRQPSPHVRPLCGFSLHKAVQRLHGILKNIVFFKGFLRVMLWFFSGQSLCPCGRHFALSCSQWA